MNPGVIIFLACLGAGLVDALVGGHWLRALWWIAAGLLFWSLDRLRRGRTAERRATPRQR